MTSMIWTAMLTAFHGFLRVSEYTAPRIRQYDPTRTLSLQDVTIAPNSVTLHIKASETDPFRQGMTIHLFRNHTHLCPIQAMLHYLSCRPHHNGPLFIRHDGRFLTRQGFAAILSKMKPIHTTSMSSHSFRIGAATAAAAARVP